MKLLDVRKANVNSKVDFQIDCGGADRWTWGALFGGLAEMREVNSTELANCWRWIDRVKEKVNNPTLYPLSLIIFDCFTLVKAYYGSKAELAKELMEQHRQLKGDWTAAELAEMEELEREIDQAKADEIAELRRDFTPPDFEELYWSDYRSLAIYLLDQSQLSEAEFDKCFGEILAHRYWQKVVIAEDGENLMVYQKKSDKDVLLAQILGE